MKSNKLISFFQKKTVRWILILLGLGLCIFLIWPASSFETDIFIPVQPEKISESLTLTPPYPKGIDVRVAGPKSSIKRLINTPLSYKLDLSNVTAGTVSIPVNKELITLPSDVRILKITPSSFNITIEQESIKIVPVTASLVNKPAAGYIVSHVAVSPASVTLKGPKSLLDPMDAIPTTPIDLNGAIESFKKETTLDLAEGMQNINPSKTISVDITIHEKTDTRTFLAVPVKGYNTRYAYHISPPAVDIQVKGPVNVLEKLEPDKSFNVYIDLKGLEPGVYMKPATILLPVGISLIHVEPETFLVEIDTKPSS